MTKETKDLVLRLLKDNDDLARARAAFRFYTPEQMQQPHGNSGQTRQEVLDDCEAHHAALQRAIKEINSL